MPDKLSVIVQSGEFNKVHYALAVAGAAIATNIPTTLFFTMGATRALLKAGSDGRPGWTRMPIEGGGGSAADLDNEFAARGVATFEDLLSACVALGVSLMVCEMGLRAMGIELSDLRGDVPLSGGGLATFLAGASRQGAMLFV
ncbi:MAG: DsrE/DsrF/DrsH-like family protein [Alphaproteobacteria bacterium]|nr:DsrE/DsrF/DrsH-like family protein [Alphaproteobacteria bacterium]